MSPSTRTSLTRRAVTRSTATRQRATRTAATAAGLVAALLTGACSEDDGTAPTAASGGGELTQEEMPLQKYMETFGGYDEDTMIAEQTEIEAIVAQCMNDEGFEYVPMDVAAQYASFSSEDVEDWNTKEWVSKNGYGMSGIEGETETGEEWVDPNADYLESLSEASMTAYYTALQGTWEPPEGLTEQEQMEWMPTWEEQGCYGLAQHEVGMEDLWQDPQYQEIKTEMSEVWEDVTKDPRIGEANAAWADCMADAGYPGLSKQEDAAMSISEAQNALWEVIEYDEANPDAGPDPDALAEVRELELATALADFTCKEEVGFDATTLQVQFDVEDQFVKDHKAELDALVATHGS